METLVTFEAFSASGRKLVTHRRLIHLPDLPCHILMIKNAYPKAIKITTEVNFQCT